MGATDAIDATTGVKAEGTSDNTARDVVLLQEVDRRHRRRRAEPRLDEELPVAVLLARAS